MNNDSRPLLRPPQFGLRTLFALVACCGALLTLWRWGVPPVVIAGIVFIVVSVGCHVAGNCLGTRLRAIGDQPHHGADDWAVRYQAPAPRSIAPPTSLGQRRSLGWSIVVATSVGVASGAIGGGLWTFVAAHGHAGLFNVLVGVIAFAVLGGMACFAACGFAQVLLGALWQAMNVPPAPSAAEPLSEPDA